MASVFGLLAVTSTRAQSIRPGSGDDSTNDVVVVDDPGKGADDGALSDSDELSSLEDSIFGIQALGPIMYNMSGGGLEHRSTVGAAPKHFTAKLARFSGQNVSMAISVSKGGKVIAVLSKAGTAGMERTIFAGSMDRTGFFKAGALHGKASLTGRVSNGMARGVVAATGFTSAFSGRISS
jgi:hypothetical protein